MNVDQDEIDRVLGAQIRRIISEDKSASVEVRIRGIDLEICTRWQRLDKSYGYAQIFEHVGSAMFFYMLGCYRETVLSRMRDPRGA